jgi:arylesterase/paraoxonase
MRIIKTILKLVGWIVLISLAFTAVLAWRGSWFRQIEPQFAGRCESLELGASAEDILVDRERGLAYLSLLDRKGLVEGRDDVQGTVAVVDLNARPLAAETALLSKPEHFRPHGLSLHIDDAGQRYLFALNHPVNRGSEPEMVELFVEARPGRFEHQRTWSDPAFLSPNDLVAVGPAQFYVANDKAEGGLGTVLQQLGVGASPLTYVDDARVEVVLDNIASGGGINASADGRYLFVAETSAQRLRVLERDPMTGAVSEVSRIPVTSSPDNVDVDGDGDLWVGAHANTLKLIQHFAAGEPAPSQVMRVSLHDNGGANGREDIYLDDGRQFSASSVGVNYGNLLLVGSITERRVLVCEFD